MHADLIHPGAVVDPQARIGRGVRIGAFAVVGPDVTLDDGVEVGHHVVLEGRIEIGPGCSIGHGSAIGGPPQDLKYQAGTPSGVRLGAGVVIREYVTIHRATRPDQWTEIGSRCLIMAAAHVAHDCRLGEGVIVINYAGIAGHCVVGDFATLGGYVGVAPFTRIGTHAYIGGYSKITADVPPFILADGVPATARSVNVIGLRRAGVAPAERRLLQDAFRFLYRSGMAPGRAIERLRKELPHTTLTEHLIAFLEAPTRRGIVAPEGGWGSTVAPATEEPAL